MKRKELANLANSDLLCRFVTEKTGTWNHDDWTAFRSEVQNAGYDSISDEELGQLLEEEKARFLKLVGSLGRRQNKWLFEPCTACQGFGCFACVACLCEFCEGAKTLVEDCPKCQGRGIAPCGRCNSSGRIGFRIGFIRWREQCPKCKGTGNTECAESQQVTCRHCAGMGRRVAACERCTSGWMICSTCQGTASALISLLKDLLILRAPYRDVGIAHAAYDDWGARAEWEPIGRLLNSGRGHMGAVSVYRQLRKFESEFMNKRTRHGITALAASQISRVKIEMKITGDGNYIPKTITIVRIDENAFIGSFGASMDLASLEHDPVEERGF
jgi:hypothetical protein